MWVQVSWIGEDPEFEESGDLPPYVNPWEIDVASYPLDLKKMNYYNY